MLRNKVLEKSIVGFTIKESMTNVSRPGEDRAAAGYLRIFEVNSVREFFEGTGGAERFWFAEIFPEADHQAVIFVKEPGIRGEIGLEKILQLLIVCAGFNQAVTGGYSGGISIDHENLSFESVEENGVGGLGPYTIYR